VIVSFGEALVDLFGEPRGSSVDTAERFVPRLGGALANVALTCARLGASARFVGAVGRDGHGDRVVRALTEAGVDVSCVARVSERTAVTFVRVGDDGSRSFLFYRTQTADHAMTSEHVDALRPLDGATWLLTGTSAQVAEPLATTARRVIADADARGLLRAVDLNVRAHLWRDADAMRDAVRRTVADAALVKASEEDLAALGLPATLDALRALAPRAVPVLTLAERGAVVGLGDRTLARPAPHVAELVDATGAGDAFMAGALATLDRHRWDDVRGDGDFWTLLLDAACALGARAVTAMGATDAVRAPWPEAVLRALPPTKATV
jgi:fructokinase